MTTIDIVAILLNPAVWVGLLLVVVLTMVASADMAARAVNWNAEIVEGITALPLAQEQRLRKLSRTMAVLAALGALLALPCWPALVASTVIGQTHMQPEHYNPSLTLIPVSEVLGGVAWAWYLLIAVGCWRRKERIVPPFSWLKDK